MYVEPSFAICVCKFYFSDGIKIKIKSDSRYNSHCCYCHCYDHWSIGYNQVGIIAKQHLIATKIPVSCSYALFSPILERSVNYHKICCFSLIRIQHRVC